MQQNQKEQDEKPFWKWLCCINEEDEDETYHQSRKWKANNLKYESNEKNSLCLMGNFQDGNFLLAKISQKNFFVDLLLRKENARSSEHIYFSLYDNGVRFDPQELQTLLPEKTIKYIACRCKNLNIVIDAFSRCGSAAIRFASFCPLVLCFERNNNHIFNLKQNSAVYKCKKKIELFETNFTDCKFRKVDLVYLHPEYIEHAQFSLIDNLKEDIRVFLPQALQTGDNVIMVLPKQTNINELMTICSFYMRVLNMQDRIIDKIELQTIQIDGEIGNYVVYIGDVAQVENQDEYEYLSRVIISDIVNEEQYYKKVYNILKYLRSVMGLRQQMDLIVQCCERAKNQDTILQHFLRQLLQDRVVQYEEIQEEFPGLIEYDQTPNMNRLSPQSINALNNSSFMVQKNLNLDQSKNFKRKAQFSFGKMEHKNDETFQMRSKILESIDIGDNSVGQQRLMDLLNNNNLLNK